MENKNLEEIKKSLILEIQNRVNDKIIEQTNAELLIELIENANTITKAIAIAELGTTYKRTGFHFDKRLEKMGSEIKYLKKNDSLSFIGNNENKHKLIIGDNYDSLLNLLISHRKLIDVIYIDPPYGSDSLGDFANTNYNNSITRDNLLSMLYSRLIIAKELLSEDGVIFVSIDDKNQSYIKCLMDDIFGEDKFLFVAPRITKKGGKSTNTIQKNHDYLIAYSVSKEIEFSQEDKDISSYTLEDDFVETRGKYKLSQTLDYNSLQYSKNMDYVIEINGRTFIPGGSLEEQQKRHNGEHGKTDWVWRWSKSAVEWGIKEGLIVIKGDRLYTKTYLNCRKINGKNDFEFIDATKSYTSLSYIENEFSNDNGKKELDKIFNESNKIFKNPKPSLLISKLIKMMCPKNDAIILDFFAGSGTTGHAVLELNKEDNGNRKFILCTNNEITESNPNGIAYDVTSKRLKRIMTGKCYDNSSNFDWIKNNEPFNDSLDVFEISSVHNSSHFNGKTPFDLINEEHYDIKKFNSLDEKISWICSNFENTQKYLSK